MSAQHADIFGLWTVFMLEFHKKRIFRGTFTFDPCCRPAGDMKDEFLERQTASSRADSASTADIWLMKRTSRRPIRPR